MTMTERSPWRFYGRDKIKHKLARMLEFQPDPHGRRGGRRQFEAICVQGRRGTGKTRLLINLQGEAPPDLPFIIQELPNPVSTGKRVGDITGDLLQKAEMAGLQGISNHVRPRSSCPNDYWWFREEVMPALLKLGAVIVFDEFHHARELGMVSDVKQVIDWGAGSSGPGRLFAPGKIVIMGSHQQNIDALFKSNAELYQRDDNHVRLHQWTLPIIMAMAAEQGILANPGRFLTLWTAYGGMPRNWERYCVSERYAHLQEIEDQNAWRKAFLSVEHEVLQGPMERFDDRAFIELDEQHRNLLLWIGRGPAKGRYLPEAPRLLGTEAEKQKSVHVLSRWHELLKSKAPVMTRNFPRWVMADNNTRMQIKVFRELVSLPRVKETDHPGNQSGWDAAVWSDGELEDNLQQGAGVLNHREVKRMETLEGQTLENLAAEWLSHQKDVAWCRSAAYRQDVEGDIDVMATSSFKQDPVRVWMGSAKRNSEEHKPMDVHYHQDRFLQALGNSKDARRLQGATKIRQLFSPSFTAEERQTFSQAGFEAIDIHDMARGFGIEPIPVIKSDYTAEEDIDHPPPQPGAPRM